MANKKSAKIVPMLSPENYIRNKARTLPIYECLISTHWKERGIANVIVARIHTNGNVTACIYLVDLFCLGIKDSFYQFNIHLTDYRRLINDMNEESAEFEKCEYALAHNIIFSALEYASDLGFKPAKEFSTVTQFMLEEDTDDIEFIDIECGKNGVPCFISGPDDDTRKINQVISQLERSVGKGKFLYYIPGDEDAAINMSEEDENDEEDEFDDYTFEEKKNLFLEWESQIESLPDEETNSLFALSNNIFQEMYDEDLVHQYTQGFLDDFEIEITEEEITAEMLGISPASGDISEEIQEMFFEIYEQTAKDVSKASKLLKQFKKQLPESAASYFLELDLINQKNSTKFLKQLAEYSILFPDYPFIKMMQIDADLASGKREAKYDSSLSIASIFPGRTQLCNIEISRYLTFLFGQLVAESDPNRIAAFEEAYEVFPLYDAQMEVLDMMVAFFKMQIVHHYLKDQAQSEQRII